MTTIPLVSVAEIKTYIPTNAGFTANDAKYAMLARQATSAIEKLCRTSFAKTDYIQYFDSYRTGRQIVDLYGSSLTGYSNDLTPQFFLLKAFPVDLAEDFFVYYDLDRVYPESSKLDPSGYIVNEEKGTLRIDSITPSYPKAFKVVYTAGYATATDPATGAAYVSGAPEDLKLACLLSVQYMFERNNLRHTNSVQRGDTDNHSDKVAKGLLPQEAINLLLEHKRYYVKRTV